MGRHGSGVTRPARPPAFVDGVDAVDVELWTSGCALNGVDGVVDEELWMRTVDGVNYVGCLIVDVRLKLWMSGCGCRVESDVDAVGFVS